MRRSILVLSSLALAALLCGQARGQGAGNGAGNAARRSQVVRPPRSNADGSFTNLEPNPTLFAVMAAINVAGYDADLDSPTNHRARAQLRNFLIQQNLPSAVALRTFVRQHRQDNPVADLGQYVAFALLSEGAPDFGPANPKLPQPPEVEALAGFAPLVAQFYREANIATLWMQALPLYEQALEPYTEPVGNIVLQVNAYLRNRSAGAGRGTFHVIVDLLGAPNQVQTRNFLDDYYVVITPSPQLRLDEIRHQYIHFVADPLAFRFAEPLNRISPLADYALASPILAPQYRDNFTAQATESLIKALEAKITRKSVMVEQAMTEGYVLAGAFYDQLPEYEKQEAAFELYFPDLVAKIDLKKEGARLDTIKFAEKEAVSTIQVTRQVIVRPTGIEGTLETGEDAIRAKDYATAKATFNQVLTGTAEKPLLARAYYGLARIAVLERDPESGDQLFRKVLDFDPDAPTRSRTLVYLGKLADSQGEGEPAKEFYRQALAVPDLPEAVKTEAEQGMKGAFFRPRNP